MKNTIQSILNSYNNDKARLMDILLDIQNKYGYISDEAVHETAEVLGLSITKMEEIISFYHFFHRRPSGQYQVYLNNSVPSVMAGSEAVKKAFEKEAGCKFGEVSGDQLIGLYETPCIGMSDQEPAAIINHVVFARLTPARVKEIVAGMKVQKAVEELVAENYGDGQNNTEHLKTMVCNNIQKRGILLDDDYKSGAALHKLSELSSAEVIDEVKTSKLSGRGGAGFPTGMKWEFCSKVEGKRKFIICNADEGEPGTFKDRVLLTEKPLLLFEGMVIAAYAVGASEGLIYVRYEYKYLEQYLQQKLQEAREKNILGKNIAGWEGFDFDIRLQFGAGAYVCGEESALIESAEGKRGEPRDRPPFPIVKGYLDCPTVVNNVETFCSVSKIINKGGEWYQSLGSEKSTGTKLLSISGDCKKPGVYEVEWGISINEMLKMAGAEKVQAVQVAGPSGVLIGPKDFDRKICYSDLPTGGSTIIFDESRDLLKEVVLNFMEFFLEESCGSCSTCRIVPTQLKKKLEKIISGNGVEKDVKDMLEWSKIMDASRCGLGKTAANPITSSINNFRYLYDAYLQKDKTFDEGFDIEKAVQASCEVVGRVPNLELSEK